MVEGQWAVACSSRWHPTHQTPEIPEHGVWRRKLQNACLSQGPLGRMSYILLLCFKTIGVAFALGFVLEHVAQRRRLDERLESPSP